MKKLYALLLLAAHNAWAGAPGAAAVVINDLWLVQHHNGGEAVVSIRTCVIIAILTTVLFTGLVIMLFRGTKR